MLYTIYKIVCKSDSQLVYVGSTKNYNQRISIHKYYANKGDKDFKVYESINANGGWDNWECFVIEHIECETRSDAIVVEFQRMKDHNATLNERAILRTPEELIIERKAHDARQYIKFREQNKAKKAVKDKDPAEIARKKAYYERPEVIERRNQLRRDNRRAKKEANIIN